MQLMSELMCTLRVHISGTALQTPLNYLHVLLMALLGPPLVALQYVMHVRLCGRRHISYNGPYSASDARM